MNAKIHLIEKITIEKCQCFGQALRSGGAARLSYAEAE